MSSNPHYIRITEAFRFPNYRGTDAVLICLSGQNFGLYVVRSGKEVYGQDSLATFIHASDLTCSWPDENRLLIKGHFETIAHNGKNVVIDERQNWVEFSFKKRKLLSWWPFHL